MAAILWKKCRWGVYAIKDEKEFIEITKTNAKWLGHQPNRK